MPKMGMENLTPDVFVEQEDVQGEEEFDEEQELELELAEAREEVENAKSEFSRKMAEEGLAKIELEIEARKLVKGIRSEEDLGASMAKVLKEGQFSLLCEAGKQKILDEREVKYLFQEVISRQNPEEVREVYLLQPYFSVGRRQAEAMIVLGLGDVLMEQSDRMIQGLDLEAKLGLREKMAIEIIRDGDQKGIAALAKNLKYFLFLEEFGFEVGEALIKHGFEREVADNFDRFMTEARRSIYEPDFFKVKMDTKFVEKLLTDHRELMLEAIAKKSEEPLDKAYIDYLIHEGLVSKDEVDQAIAKYKAEHPKEAEKKVEADYTTSRRHRERLEAEESEEMPVTNPVMLEAFKRNLEGSNPPYQKTLELSDGKSFESHLILPAVYEKSDTLKTIGLWVPDYSQFSLADTNNPHEWVARNLKEFLAGEAEAAKDFSSDFEPVRLNGSIYLIPGKLDDEMGFYIKVDRRADEDKSFVNRIMGLDLQRILKTLKAYGAFGVIVPDDFKIPEPLKESGFFVKLKDKDAISDSEKRMVDILQTQEFFEAMKDNPGQDVLNLQKQTPDILDRSQLKDGTGFYQHEGD